MLTVPAYKNFTAKGQAQEAIGLAGALTDSVNQYYLDNAAMPLNTAAMGLTATTGPHGRYVEQAGFAIDNGAFVLKFAPSAANGLAGTFLRFTPAIDADGSVQWLCGTKAASAGFTAVTTTVQASTAPANLLPPACSGA